jgi:GTP-binding protein
MTVQVLSAEFASATTSVASMPAPVFAEVAFAGRSNVGKSTLLSALSGRKALARVSKDPGRTRALVFFDVKVREGKDGADVQMQFVDLPGYGYAKISKSEAAAWKPLIEAYLQTRTTLRTVLVLVDIRRGPQQEERDLLEFLAQPAQIERTQAVTAKVVATKLDKLPRHERKPALKKLRDELGLPVYGVSGESGEGLEELWNVILASAL